MPGAVAAAVAQAEIVRLDFRAIGKDDGAVDHVAKLPHVAVPTVSEQARASPVAELEAGPASLAPIVLEEEINKQANVFAAVAQRRQM